MATQIGFDPSTWNATAEAPFKLGQLVERSGVLYRYVLVQTAACADGAVMCEYDATTPASGKVIGAHRTSALTGTPAAIIVVGLGIGAISIGRYGFLQVSGVHTNVMSGTSTLGRWQMASAATNDTCNDCTSSIAYTEAVFGIALSSTGGARCIVRLKGLV